MDTEITRITPEEAQAFRDRVRRQREEIAKMVVFDIDTAIRRIEALEDKVQQLEQLIGQRATRMDALERRVREGRSSTF